MIARATAPGAAGEASRRMVERVVALSGREPRAALRLARRALAGASRWPPGTRARLLRAQGHALRAVGEYAAARRAYRASRRLLAGSGVESERALAAIGLVDACMYLGRTEEALAAAREARPVFQRNGDVRRVAMLETNLGNLFHREDRLEESLAHYERAGRLLESVGSPVDQATVDHNLGNVFIMLGRRDEAARAFRRARRICDEHGAKVLAAQTRYGVACLHFLSGEYAAAITELEEVRPELERIGARPLLALADLDLAEMLLSIRLLPESLALSRAATRWFAARGVPADLARCLLASGSALTLLDRPRAAAAALDAAGRLFRDQHVPTGSAAVWVARAHLARRAGRLAEAVRHGREAYRVFAGTGLGLRALSAGAMTAECLLSAGHVSRARNLARHLRRLPARPGDAYSRSRLARVEAAAAARAGDPRAALALYGEALDHARRAESALFVDEWRVGFLEGEPALLDEALGTLFQRRPRPRPREVWRWLGASARGRRARARPREIGPDVRRRTAELRQELEACYGRLWQRQSSGARRPGPAATHALEQRASMLEGRLRRLAAGSPSAEPVSAAGFEVRPDRGQVRLRYFSAGGRLGALRSDADGLTLWPDLVPLEELQQHVRLFHYQMEVLSSTEPALRGHREMASFRAERHLATLAERVLAPALEGCADPRELQIVPYGPLFRLPWHALPWRGEPLVRSCAVSLGTSGGPGSHPPTDRSGALVLGCGDAGSEDIEAEARDVAVALRAGGVPVRLYVGDEARRDAVLDAAREVAFVHVAGHALYRSEHPEFSALRLRDGWLHARDLAMLPLDGVGVVLAACESGPRGAVAGQEMLGLVRGLARAGARSTVTTLWKVDDSETRRFMSRFYHHWRELGRIGAALNAVQRESSERGLDLFLWAPFCLMGDPGLAWPAADEAPISLRAAVAGTYA